MADARREGLSLEQAQEKLGGVSLPVSDSGLMASVQRENVRLAWKGHDEELTPGHRVSS